MRIANQYFSAVFLPKDDVKHHRANVLRFVEKKDVETKLFPVQTRVNVQSRMLKLVHFHVTRVRKRHWICLATLHRVPDEFCAVDDIRRAAPTELLGNVRHSDLFRSWNHKIFQRHERLAEHRIRLALPDVLGHFVRAQLVSVMHLLAPAFVPHS